jgi:hypothetical protein
MIQDLDLKSNAGYTPHMTVAQIKGKGRNDGRFNLTFSHDCGLYLLSDPITCCRRRSSISRAVRGQLDAVSFQNRIDRSASSYRYEN